MSCCLSFSFKSIGTPGLLLFLLGTMIISLPWEALCAEARNVRLVGHCGLQGRDALQVVLKGSFAYVGHHRGVEFNPLTGKPEPNGTTIVDVSDPSHPRIIKHIPGYPGAESRAGAGLHILEYEGSK